MRAFHAALHSMAFTRRTVVADFSHERCRGYFVGFGLNTPSPTICSRALRVM